MAIKELVARKESSLESYESEPRWLERLKV